MRYRAYKYIINHLRPLTFCSFALAITLILLNSSTLHIHDITRTCGVVLALFTVSNIIAYQNKRAEISSTKAAYTLLITAIGATLLMPLLTSGSSLLWSTASSIFILSTTALNITIRSYEQPDKRLLYSSLIALLAIISAMLSLQNALAILSSTPLNLLPIAMYVAAITRFILSSYKPCTTPKETPLTLYILSAVMVTASTFLIPENLASSLLIATMSALMLFHIYKHKHISYGLSHIAATLTALTIALKMYHLGLENNTIAEEFNILLMASLAVIFSANNISLLNIRYRGVKNSSSKSIKCIISLSLIVVLLVSLHLRNRIYESVDTYTKESDREQMSLLISDIYRYDNTIKVNSLYRESSRHLAEYREQHHEHTDVILKLSNVLICSLLLVLIAIYIIYCIHTKHLDVLEHNMAKVSRRQPMPLEEGDHSQLSLLIKEYNKLIEEHEQWHMKDIMAERQLAWNKMTRVIAHEVKNLLTPIMLKNQMLLFKKEHNMEQWMDMVEDSCKCSISQTKKINVMMRNIMQSPEKYLHKSSGSDIRQLLSEIIKLQSGEKIIFKTSHALDTLDIKVNISPEELWSILNNIVINAIDAIHQRPSGGGAIIFDAKIREQRCTLTIWNNGLCIPEDVLPNIFNYRFTTKSEGNGYGLYHVRKLIHLAGGDISVASDKDKGTVFKVCLPVVVD